MEAPCIFCGITCSDNVEYGKCESKKIGKQFICVGCLYELKTAIHEENNNQK